MMDEKKIGIFVLELTKKTIQEKIIWQTILPKNIKASYDTNVLNFIYRTEISNRHFWLYKYKTKYYRDEYDWDWIEKIMLEMIDENYNSLYAFPYDYSLVNLYEAVREKTSGISELLDDILEL